MARKPEILVVDDEKSHRDILAKLLQEWGYGVCEAANGKEALQKATNNRIDAVLLDAHMPVMDGYKALAELHRLKPGLPLIMMTAWSEIPAAVEAMRLGAWDYLPKPLDFPRLKDTLAKACGQTGQKTAPEELRSKTGAKDHTMIGASPPMRELTEMIARIAPTEATVLINGESGTGKELAARAIHDASLRKNGPFVALNCGALTESLLASELFGHEKGAFTGADKKHDGLFLQATGGSIFLDEVGEMPPAMQVKLLRVLQEREIASVGSNRPIPIDCRIIAATNRDLAQEVEAGRFREDLFYRLNVVPLTLPPLRERREDIPLLAERFAQRFAKINGKNFTGMTPEALRCLKAWAWPGNVRELENVIERAIILMPGSMLDEKTLPEKMRCPDLPGSAQPDWSDSLPTLEEVERKVILETLRKLDNNKTEAARALGITRKTLHAKINRYLSGDK